MTRLFVAATEQGLKSMRGEVLSANTSMQKLMRKLGFSVKKDPEEPSLCLVERLLTPIIEVPLTTTKSNKPLRKNSDLA